MALYTDLSLVVGSFFLYMTVRLCKTLILIYLMVDGAVIKGSVLKRAV